MQLTTQWNGDPRRNRGSDLALMCSCVCVCVCCCSSFIICTESLLDKFLMCCGFRDSRAAEGDNNKTFSASKSSVCHFRRSRMMSTARGIAAWFYGTAASWVEWRAAVEHNLHAHIAVYSQLRLLSGDLQWKCSLACCKTYKWLRDKIEIATLNPPFVELLKTR